MHAFFARFGLFVLLFLRFVLDFSSLMLLELTYSQNMKLHIFAVMCPLSDYCTIHRVESDLKLMLLFEASSVKLASHGIHL